MLIKRYANRKLYDTEARRYITLEEIEEAVRQGIDIRVIDHESGADLTGLTLLQVIFEQQKKIGSQMPQIILTRLIQSGTTAIRDLKEGLLAFSDPERHFEDEVQRRLELVARKGLLAQAEAERLRSILISPDLRKSSEKPMEEEASSEQVASLLRQVQELEEQLAHLEGK